MARCDKCIHCDVCFTVLDAAECKNFKDRSRFVELPFPISGGTKLRYIFKDETGELIIGEDYEVVTRVCKDGFYVSGRFDSDGTYRQGDDFYPWGAIGTEYFFTLEEAEQALKEIENDGK